MSRRYLSTFVTDRRNGASRGSRAPAAARPATAYARGDRVRTAAASPVAEAGTTGRGGAAA
ncbi:hypothetical protein, partial [Streptomyces chilikensis]|uniref:hypothetical protein n=1 Tax=Streptomyces chilikensis TaxID=1194079 RepID=UPI0019D15746